MNEIDSPLDTGQGAWQTQKTAVWNRSHRDRPILRELSVAWLDRSPSSRLWRPVLYLQRAPGMLKWFGNVCVLSHSVNFMFGCEHVTAVW